MGDPRLSGTRGGAPVGAVVAVVLLMLGSGVAALYSLFVLPFASDTCEEADTHLICTGAGQQAVAVVPLMTAFVGTALAACSCALRPPFRAVGVGLGYLISAGGFGVALAIAFRA